MALHSASGAATDLAVPVGTPGRDLLLLILALVLGLASALLLRQPWAQEPALGWLWWTLLAAALAGGVALCRTAAWLVDGQPPAHAASTPAPGRRVAGGLLFCLAVLIADWVMLRLLPSPWQWQGTVLPWVAALAAVLASGWLMGGVGEAAPPSPDPGGRAGPGMPAQARQGRPFPRRLEWLLCLALLLLALFLRLHRLHEIPGGLYVDETNAAVDAILILEGHPASPFGTGWYETPNAFIYYMAGLIRLFGANYTTLKLVSLLPAMLTIPAVYLLARALFGPSAALLSMAFLATSRWHLTMSRWGWNETAPPLFLALAVCCLIWAFRERRALGYTAAGLLGGLGVYTYLSSRLALLTLALFAVVWLLADPAGVRAGVRRHALGLLLMVLATVVAVAPIAVTYLTDPFTFINRTSEISILREIRAAGSLDPLWQNIWNHVQMFYQRGDPTGRQNIPSEPQTEPLTALLLALGLVHALLRPRDRRRALLLIWFVVNMAGGYLSEVGIDSPNAYRTLNALVAVVILAGESLDRMARAVAALVVHRWRGRISHRWGPLLGGALAVTLLCTAAYQDVTTYFGRQADSVAVQMSFNPLENQLARTVLDGLEAGALVYLSPRFFTFSPVRYLVWGEVWEREGRAALADPPYRWLQFAVDLPLPDQGQDLLLLLEPNYGSLLDHLWRFYPRAEVERVRGPAGEPLFLRVWVPRSQVAELQGLEATWYLADGTQQRQWVTEIGAAWGDRPVVAAHWQGGLWVEEMGSYRLFNPAGLLVAVDGRPWQDGRVLGRGLHDLEVSLAAMAGGQPPRLEWVEFQDRGAPLAAPTYRRIGRSGQGLLGTYSVGAEGAEEPLFSQVTPFLMLAWPPAGAMPHSFRARFTGTLLVPAAGLYRLRIHADDGARLWLDGRVVGEAMTPFQPNQILVELELEAGSHPIRIDYFQEGGGSALEFTWQPPQGGEEPVPPQVLRPE